MSTDAKIMYSIGPMIRLFCLFIIYQVLAEADFEKKMSLLQSYNQSPDWSETIKFIPLDGYHMNLKSHHKCGRGKRLELTETAVVCEMSRSGRQIVELFVCDEKKTFCKREELEIHVRYPRDVAGWFAYLRSFFN